LSINKFVFSELFMKFELTFIRGDYFTINFLSFLNVSIISSYNYKPKWRRTTRSLIARYRIYNNGVIMSEAVKKKAVISIEGMHCGHCVSAITDALKKLRGVSEAEVLLTTGKARVVYDPSLAKTEEFTKAIQALGFIVKGIKE
jgi:copper chaperone